jgi:hypothetical protein
MLQVSSLFVQGIGDSPYEEVGTGPEQKQATTRSMARCHLCDEFADNCAATCSHGHPGQVHDEQMKGRSVPALGILLAVASALGTLAVLDTNAAGSRFAAAALTARSPTRSTASSGSAFAARVLAEAPLPAGSQPAKSVPTSLDQPMQRPGTPGLVDLYRIYATPESPSAVTNDVLAHLPPGAKRTGTGTFGGPSGAGSGFVLTLPTSGQNEYLAEIVYSIVPHQGGSVVRIDAQCVWEPDRLRSETIPRGATAKLTGYAALSLARPSSEAATVVLDASDSDCLANSLNGLPVAPQPNCLEDSVLYQVVFHAPNGADFDATGDECEGTVELSVNGRQLAPLNDARCSVLHLVATYLPARATGTRKAAAQCRSND